MAHQSQENPADNTGNLRWGARQRIDNPKQGSARIIDAARQCYAEFGVTSTTIDHVAERAGVSRRTVYRYFDNKEAVIRAVVEEQAEPFFEELRETLQSLEGQSFRQLLTYYVLFTVEKGPLMPGHQLLLGQTNAAATAGFYLRSAHTQNKMHTLLHGQFEQAQQSGEIDSGWLLDDVLNWSGRLIYSFIQHPEKQETVERMVQQFLMR